MRIMLNSLRKQAFVRSSSRFVNRCLVAGASLGVIANQAFAQKEGRVPGEEKGVLQWAIAIGLVALICFVSFVNSKRSHQN